MSETKLISLAEAAFRHIERVRVPTWANQLDHIKIDIIDQAPGLGPWLHLYAPFNQECNGRDPVSFIWAMAPQPLGKINIFEAAYEAYSGPHPDSDSYRAAAAQFAGRLGGSA